MLSKSKCLLGLIFLLCAMPVFAAQCPSPIPIEVQSSEQIAYSDSVRLGKPSELIEFRNFKSGEFNRGQECSFEVKNLAAVEVMVTVNYDVQYDDKLVSESFSGLKIDPNSFRKIGEYPTSGSCTILEESITFDLHETLTVSLQRSLEKSTEAQCVSCSSGADCPTGNCHNGFCALNCPSGTSACNGNCYDIATKGYGEEYLCEFQCSSGMGNGNLCIECVTDAQCQRGLCDPKQSKCTAGPVNGNYDCTFVGQDYVPCEATSSCVLPSSKELGESYRCTDECVSGYGSGGVCKRPPSEQALIFLGFLTFIGIAGAALWFKLNLHKKNKELKEKDEALKATKEEYKKVDKSKKDLVSDKEKAEKAAKKAKDKQKEAEEKSAKAEKEAEKKVEREYQKELESQKREFDKKNQELEKEYDQQKKEISKKEEEIIEQKKNVDRLIEVLKITEARARKPRKSTILGKGVWEWNNPKKEYYPCYWNGEGKNNDIEIHIDRAIKKIFLQNKEFFTRQYPGIGYEKKNRHLKFISPVGEQIVVHHIDNDPNNYRLRNLAIITRKEHHKISHDKIKRGDWKSGIKAYYNADLFKQPQFDEEQ